MRNGTYFYTSCEESASFFRDSNSMNFYGRVNSKIRYTMYLKLRRNILIHAAF